MTYFYAQTICILILTSNFNVITQVDDLATVLSRFLFYLIISQDSFQSLSSDQILLAGKEKRFFSEVQDKKNLDWLTRKKESCLNYKKFRISCSSDKVLATEKKKDSCWSSRQTSRDVFVYMYLYISTSVHYLFIFTKRQLIVIVLN